MYVETKNCITITITIREYTDNPVPEFEITVDNTDIRVYNNKIDEAIKQVETIIMHRLKNANSLHK